MVIDPHRTYPCRCRKCLKRKRLSADAVETAVCDRKRCGGTMRIDRYRDSRENGPHNTCDCDNYHFPHHVGRGWCRHNDKLTAEDFQRREEEGSWPKR